MTTSNAPVRLPDPREHPTLPIWPDTGQLLGLSRQSTYDAAHRGEIPTIRIGRRILVPTAALARLLAVDDFPAA
jgi:excisionase family DNA binding protein